MRISRIVIKKMHSKGGKVVSFDDGLLDIFSGVMLC